jgi:hypothetical protein
MRQFALCLVLILVGAARAPLKAQQHVLSGLITDSISGEPLLGAAVMYAPGKGVTADLEGRFWLSLPAGTHTLEIRFLGYDSKEIKVQVPRASELHLRMSESKGHSLQEFQLVSDLAKPRETPVAYSNVSAQQITEKLGGQDLPMLLNATPGVYATQQGGGDGDARISIRGFSAQNVLVMVDGVPMNDMFNGRVYWTNWFGLDQMTQTMQVQRGLGASKLAIPAIGGTMNIMTRGIQMNKSLSIKQELGNDQNLRTVISGSTGRLKGDWSLQAALSYKNNRGWVEGLSSQMFFYFLKINKEVKNHAFSFSAFGAPQESGQRSFLYAQRIQDLDANLAHSLGIDTSNSIARGNRFYSGWNEFVRTRSGNRQQDSLYASGAITLEQHMAQNNLQRERMTTTVNGFHKPVMTFQHSWKASKNWYLKNIAYASFGSGGGSSMVNDGGSTISVNDSTGKIKLQELYNENISGLKTGQETLVSKYILRKDHNDHSWYGFLSTVEGKLPLGLTFSGGIDGRYYNGRVFSTVLDLMGGDVFKVQGQPNQNRAAAPLIRVGDTLRQHIERDILWGGAFGMLEFKGEKLTAFVNLSGSVSGYKQYNHFLKRQLTVGDTVLNIGFSDTLQYQGNIYTRNSPGLRSNASDQVWAFGYTVKGGANYNLTKRHNVYANVGYFSRVPYFTFLITTANRLVKETLNEELYSAELGYGYRSKKFALQANAYYTLWNNKPTAVSFTIDGEAVRALAGDMGARHMGLELDFTWKPWKFLSVEGMASLGDWIWNKQARAQIIDESDAIVDEVVFDPRGVKVGDAAQHTYSLSTRWMPIKRLYIMPEFQYFSQNYANFDPSVYQVTDIPSGFGPNLGRQAWRMPDYYLLNLYAGYHFYIKDRRIDLRGSLNNITDLSYISDASDNNAGSVDTFNAASATVYAGLGFRWMFSVTATF